MGEIQSTMEVDTPERGPQLKKIEPEIQLTKEVDPPEIQSTMEANAAEGWIPLKKAEPNTPLTVEANAVEGWIPLKKAEPKTPSTADCQSRVGVSLGLLERPVVALADLAIKTRQLILILPRPHLRSLTLHMYSLWIKFFLISVCPI